MLWGPAAGLPQSLLEVAMTQLAPPPPGRPSTYFAEPFTAHERAVLSRHVTNIDGPVFALVGLPQVTAAALFARYSRSAKSLRRLLLDEFLGDAVEPLPAEASDAGRARAGDLFGRVLAEYGDDSVAQLAGVHIACEQVSQPLAKAIEWGRLAGYLEQSTRYIPYTDRRDGRYRYHLDPNLMASPSAAVYVEAMDGLFDTYCALLDLLREHLDSTIGREEDERARRRAIRALALDLLRGLLPAGTVSNVGVFASPQAYEQMVLRLRAHRLPEARTYAELIAAELQKVVPEFLTRLERPDRGGVWVDYLADTAAALEASATVAAPSFEQSEEGVRLVDWTRDGEDRILAASLLPHSRVTLQSLLETVHGLAEPRRDELFAAAVGERGNRRHRPGRGFEHCEYTFEVVSDYGAFRDLQRHRMLTIQWQPLTPSLGYVVPATVEEAGLGPRWRGAVERAEAAYEGVAGAFPEQAQYLVTLGHRLRYVIRMNAREAMHLIELRTSPQGHPHYRRVGQEMHRLIDQVAGHHRVAAAMRFVGADDVHLPRYAAERGRVGEDGDSEAGD
ncbi:MAG: FAD-dependent thymidylate synthase [Candidatus Dormibacteraeota bacterium]|uniref:FAD-dependent thymidylate synthase n=1 Tax=Candidatus Amunia macphersoniae TaxID=3127014 RepID=A0A934KMI0_9BACT|nr:FAD-dependent thymidylate synthase [Candidatus Dormibacteraeota bacterium]